MSVGRAGASQGAISCNINPDDYIECSACEPECPVIAIFHDSAPYPRSGKGLPRETAS
jgi:NAD-dependent dihydropyrimidine dehydrogenase PreA subunit